MFYKLFLHVDYSCLDPKWAGKNGKENLYLNSNTIYDMASYAQGSCNLAICKTL